MNLCVLEDRKSLSVEDNDIFYLVLLYSFLLPFPPISLSPPGYCVRSRCHCIPPSIFALLLCFLSPFYFSSLAHIHEQSLNCRYLLVNTKETVKHVCARAHESLVCFSLCEVMYAAPLSTYKQGYNRQMEQCTMNVCWATMRLCVGSGPMRLSPHL